MSTPFQWDDRQFMKAIKAYCDLKKNVDPKTELRRRGKNVGMRLIGIYKKEGVERSTIISKVADLGERVKLRPKIRARWKTKRKGKKGNIWTYGQMIAAELRARLSAVGFTSTGWFPSTEKLGGNPRRIQRPGGGPRRGKLIEKLGFFGEMSETLVNEQPGAAHTQNKNKSLEQQALDAEVADMVKHIVKKQNEAARRNGL